MSSWLWWSCYVLEILFNTLSLFWIITSFLSSVSSPSTNSYKLLIDLRWSWDFMSLFPLVLGFSLACSHVGLVPVVTAAVRFHVWYSIFMPSKHCFLGNVHWHWLLESVCPFFDDFLRYVIKFSHAELRIPLSFIVWLLNSFSSLY